MLFICGLLALCPCLGIISCAAMTLQETVSTTPTANFPFVHPTIASVLRCQRSADSPSIIFLDTKTVRIHGWEKIPRANASSLERAPVLKDSLIGLAQECDAFVFEQKGLVDDDKSIQTLIEWGQSSDAEILLASLLALNRLEAAIRHAAGHTMAGRAPLLKNMIQHLQEEEKAEDIQSISNVLQTLLLPNPGLNLRNLLWHGFVTSLPRPWLAMVLVLIHILERDNARERTTSTKSNLNMLTDLRSFASYSSILQHGDALLHTDLAGIDTAWISREFLTTNDTQHNSISMWDSSWDLIRRWISEKKDCPLCICIILTCLLENGLRQEWCRANDRPEDRIARPASFYVTLDGHGQRHQHDVLLHPYIGEEYQARNALITSLGGSIMALLTDMYCSPSGPNLRASLAHGTLDDFLDDELIHKGTDRQDNDRSKKQVWDLVRVLVALMDGIGKVMATPSVDTSFLAQYRPVFSYTAVTCRKLERAVAQLAELQELSEDDQYIELLEGAKRSANLQLGSIEKLRIPLKRLKVRAETILQQASHMNNHSRPWNEQDIFKEHENNQVMAPLGATRALFHEVAEACESFRSSFEGALHQREVNKSTRQRRQRLRILASLELAWPIFSFAAEAALIQLEYDLAEFQPKDINATRLASENRGNLTEFHTTLLQAVKRSRMVVSTTSNFIFTNTDRAVKAGQELTKSQAVKCILSVSDFSATTFEKPK